MPKALLEKYIKREGGREGAVAFYMMPHLDRRGLNMMMCLFSSCSSVMVRAALRPVCEHASVNVY